jgi:DNA-binding MarR family transcriptional regulator
LSTVLGKTAAMNTRTARTAGAAHADGYACVRAWSALRAAHAAVTDRLTEALAGYHLSINEFEVLLRLDRAEPPGARLAELQSAAPLTQPSLSRLVARLDHQGWVARTGDPADGRGVRVALTPAGRALLDAAVPVHARTIREALLDQLAPDEQDLLAEVLSRIAG